MYYPPMMAGVPMQMASYEIRDFKVFFGTQYVSEANWIGFTDLGQGYGKDTDHVFFMGQIMENVHPFFFQVVGNTYAKDDQHVFQYGRIVQGLHPQTFVPPMNVNNGPMIMQPMNPMYPMNPMNMAMPTNEIPIQIPPYEVRDFKVFFGTQYLSAARWIDFTDLGRGYGKDGHHVFFMGQIIGGAHPFSFEVLNNGYAKDNKHVFQHGRIVEGLKPFGFQGP